MPLLVDSEQADEIVAEAIVNARVRKQIALRVAEEDDLGYDPKELQDDLKGYGEYVHGYKPARHHQYWCDILERLENGTLGKRKVLFLAPPNTAKSIWMTVIFGSWYLGKHPSHSVLFFTSSDDMAQDFHTVHKTTFSENPRFDRVFPDPKTRPHMKRGWSGHRLFLRGRPASEKDPTIRSVGWNTSVIGGRANGIIMDDPLTQEDSQSQLQMGKHIRYYTQTVQPRLQPDGWVVAVMTRWSEFDLGDYLKRQAAEENDWLIVELPMEAYPNDGVHPPDPLGREPGELLWPERLTPAWVAATKKALMVADYNVVYQLDPTMAGGEIFAGEHFWRDLPPNFWTDILKECLIVQGWDTAFSSQSYADFTVCVTLAVDKHMNTYLLHVFRERLAESEIEKAIVRMAVAYRPIVIGIELPAFRQQNVRDMIRNVLVRKMLNIQPVPWSVDKVARAKLPARYAGDGKVFADKSAPWYRGFIGECMAFPKGRFDDQVDAWSVAAHVVSILSFVSYKVKQVVIGD